LIEQEIREALAAVAHSQWSGWMRYMFEKCVPVPGKDGGLYIPKEFVERWTRQMQTPYDDLPENEKESDRTEADMVLAVLRALPPEPAAAPGAGVEER
jgi:hypothetical protein